MPASRRDIVTTLLEHHPAAQPRSAGMRVTRMSRNERFLMLGLSTLFASRLDLAVATRAISELRRRGLDSPDALAKASLNQLKAALAAAGYGAGSSAAAEILRELGRSVEREYGGDLEQLRKRADRDPAAERKMLKGFFGVGNVAVDIFFQNTQAAWKELFPFLAPRARHAAEELGLPGEPRSLAKLAGGQLPLLGASLVQVYSMKDYDKVLFKARFGSYPAEDYEDLLRVKAKRSFDKGPTFEDFIKRAKSRQAIKRATKPKPHAPRATPSPGPAPPVPSAAPMPSEHRGQRAKPPLDEPAVTPGSRGAAPPPRAAAANGDERPPPPPPDGPPTTGVGGGPPPPDAPSREVPPRGHALLRTPGTAVVGEFFPVTFGLAKTRSEAGAETGLLEGPGWPPGRRADVPGRSVHDRLLGVEEGRRQKGQSRFSESVAIRQRRTIPRRHRQGVVSPSRLRTRRLTPHNSEGQSRRGIRASVWVSIRSVSGICPSPLAIREVHGRSSPPARVTVARDLASPCSAKHLRRGPAAARSASRSHRVDRGV